MVTEKKHNYIYGHQMGDDALRLIASALIKSLKRPDDYCFRLGGEEFGMVFKAKEKNLSLTFVSNIKENIEALNIVHSSDEIYIEADSLLYPAKKSGRNRVVSNIPLDSI